MRIGTGSARGLLAVLALAVLVAGLPAARGQVRSRVEVRKFMRQKLDLSKDVLEGLTIEDYGMVARGAGALKGMSEEARWRVSPNVNYLRLSAVFQDLADDLATKAKARNLDGATLAYLKLTANCVDCHKLVRDQRLISLR
jgi:hypothetical protein